IEGDSIELSRALSLPLKEVRIIRDIQAFWAIDLGSDGIPDRIDYKDSYDANDTINVRMTDRFTVRVRLSKSPEFLQFTKYIIEYARNNPLFQQKNQVRLAQNSEIRERLIYDIDQLDSLQKIKYFEETRKKISPSGGQLVFLQEKNAPTELIYDNIYTLYARKQAIDSEMEIYKDILTLLNDFTQPARPIDASILYYGKHYIPMFFIGTLILLILFANRKKLVEVYKKY
ncbi:MAG: hypothetical protein Q7J06_00735, partial [Bacteroidales bacterium]|nr:hypothetical protein [Bacteroidales bacterium]